MSDEAAQAVGFLETTPFVDLLVHAFDHRLTGTLVLEEPSGSRHGVYFEAGTPRKVKTAATVASLGEVLVQTGVISERTHERTLARALEEHVLHGRVLVEDGLITEQALSTALREQLLRQMLWLFERPQGTRYGYFDGSNFLENWGAESGSRISVMEVLWRGLRDHAGHAEIQALLDRLGGRAIALREDMPLDYFYFMGSDRDVIELLSQRPQRLDELYQTAPALRDVIERVICLLLLSRSVDLGTRTAPPLGLETNVEVSSWSIPSAGIPSGLELSSPEESEQAAGSSPVPMTEPEIASQSDASELGDGRIAFGEQERLDGDEQARVDGDEQAQVDGGEQARVDDDVQVRVDDDVQARVAGGEQARVAGGEQAREETVLAAAAAFRKAEALLAGGHLARAEAEARFALESEPGRAEHVALCAWIDVLKPGADASRISLELKRALVLAENNVKVHWYRGLTLQHLGRHDHALREFRAVLELDPNHLDALRQIRVYEMRLEKSPRGRPSLAPEPESSGGWFRRKR